MIMKAVFDGNKIFNQAFEDLADIFIIEEGRGVATFLLEPGKVSVEMADRLRPNVIKLDFSGPNMELVMTLASPSLGEAKIYQFPLSWSSCARPSLVAEIRTLTLNIARELNAKTDLSRFERWANL